MALAPVTATYTQKTAILKLKFSINQLNHPLDGTGDSYRYPPKKTTIFIKIHILNE